MRHRLIAPLCVAVTVAALAGCAQSSTAESAAAECENPLSSGAVSDAYAAKASVPLGDSIKPATALPVTVAQRTVTTADQTADTATIARSVSASETAQGKAVVAAPAIVTADINIYDSVTGARVYSTSSKNSAADFLAVPEKRGLNVLSDAALCALPGQRVTVAMTPKEAAGFLRSGLSEGAAAIAYIDVKNTSNFKASGKEQPLPNGFPAVTRTAAGDPGVVLPPQQAPSELRSALRIKGEGRSVHAGSNVVAQVLSVSWAGKVTASTWNDGPMIIPADDPAVSWRNELNGVPVGSQVVILMPAKSDASQATPAQVLVVDVLASE
ncbi:hypothetical protein KJY77_01740 [Canibacter sp. lx-72]|uniref:hypothetical protein n=1 Tax=Canibacter zhuwentaonis TaxID=2837491 RepID=UPI001BDC08EC|nr:hypothetical protein [Canibacter zhuwentaonis]MBT1017865.1 hypothetical protein [Canibacter zhuwentaonis]MBT1035028.1 hypothetical protein [Canibacter zhuwentaonis]